MVMKHLLFVCAGNAFRSPMAAALMRQTLLTSGKTTAAAVEIDSAGVSAWEGDGASEEAIEVMRGYGIDLTTHRSKGLSNRLIQWADLILTMMASYKADVVYEFPEAQSKTHLLTEFVGMTGDVEDPMYTGDYEGCARQLDELVHLVLAKLS